MADEEKSSELKSGGVGPTLFYIMLGVILALLLLFLIVRPKGTQSGGSDQKKSSLECLPHRSPLPESELAAYKLQRHSALRTQADSRIDRQLRRASSGWA